jgi:hypothetical protein
VDNNLPWKNLLSTSTKYKNEKRKARLRDTKQNLDRGTTANNLCPSMKVNNHSFRRQIKVSGKITWIGEVESWWFRQINSYRACYGHHHSSYLMYGGNITIIEGNILQPSKQELNFKRRRNLRLHWNTVWSKNLALTNLSASSSASWYRWWGA